MNEIKKLLRLRRVLATALALVMVVTSTPVTVHAAVPDEGQAVTETAAENDSAQENDNTGEETKLPDADTSADDGQNAEDMDASADDGQDVPDVDTSADDGQDVPDTDTSADDGQDASTDDGQTTTSAEGSGQETETDAAAQPQAELGGSEFTLEDGALKEYEYTEAVGADNTYTPVSPFADGTVLSGFFFTVNKGTDMEQTLRLDETGNATVDTVTWQWLQDGTALDTPKKLSEEGMLPVDAGEYTLRLVLPAKENEYEGAEDDFTFEITKSEVFVDTLTPDTVAVGTKWSDIPVPVDSVYAMNGRSFTYNIDDPDTTVNEAAKNEVSFTTVVKDAATGVALAGDETLKKDGEYVIGVVPAFVDKKYEKNYTWRHVNEQKLEIGELKETRLTLTPDAAYKAVTAAVTDDKRTVYVIEDASLIKNLAKLEYTSVLEAEDGTDAQGNPKWKEIDASEVAAEWYTAATYGGTWKENDKTFCSYSLGGRLDENEVPENTGAYVYRVGYEGDQKEYAASYADIVVVIEAAEIIVKPVASGKTFYDGQSVKDVLSQITYELPYADGRQGVYPQTEYMWGTSYQPDGVTQPYKPDFELVEIVRDKDGTETARHTYNSSGADYNSEIYGAVLVYGNEYFVRFNGKKNVYTASGMISTAKNINDQVDSMDPKTCGFKVKTDSETLENNTCALTVAKKDKAIDVSEIEKAAGQKESVGALENAFVKTYDGKRIFDLFADYKKAKLTSGESDSVADFTYKWTKSRYSYEDLLEKDQDNKDAWAVSREDLDAENGTWVSGISPYDAGVYRLRVAYQNSRKNGFAEPVDLYFVIKRQDIAFGFTKQNLTGNVGNSIYEFAENHRWELADSTTLTPALTQPTKAEDWKNADGADWDDVYQYEVNWGFYQKRMKTDAEGNPTQEQETDADGNLLWDQVYMLSGTGEYYLGAESIELSRPSSIAKNYKVSNDVYCPVTVKSMGQNQIRFTGITTADGKVIEKTKTYDAESVYALIKDDFAKLNAPLAFLVDETGAETDKSESVNFAEGEYGLKYTVSYTDSDGYLIDPYIYYDEFPTEEDAWAWTANAGVYQISASFGGNENYAVLDDTLLAEITVEQKELTLTVPALEREFEAGQSVAEVLDEAETIFREADTAAVKPADGVKIPDADMQKYFTKTEKDGDSGFLAWYDSEVSAFYAPEFYVADRELQAEYTYNDGDILLQGAGDKRYSLNAYGAGFSGDCYNNYLIAGTEPAEGTPVTVVRGASMVDIWGYDDNHLDDGDPGKEIDIRDEISVPDKTDGSIVKEHTVTILDGIPYDNNRGDGGNIVDICIIAPAEYGGSVDWSQVYYKQAIRNAAGDRLVEEENIRLEGDVLSFTYDATVRKGEKREDLDFCIRWEEGYSERFIIRFSGAELLGDLTEAVQPKSLAFNAARTSMVVGEEQELDVKITKVQNADIICLGYEVTKETPKGNDGQKVMHIDEYGKVTALAEGKATVEVFPMHLVNGVKKKIDDCKPAKVDITVKNVSAPKVSKVISYANEVEVQYTPPKANDGYRREIYVVKGKAVKEKDIEDLIANAEDKGMQNQQWEGIFASAPMFIPASRESNYRIRDKKGVLTNTVGVYVSGLDPQEEYTVYVRNVSAVRSFADGCQVTLSAAGTAKACKTTMRTVSDITAQLKDEPVRWIDEYELEEGETVTPDLIADAYTVGYEVPLIENGKLNSVDIALEGEFYETAGDLAKGMRLPLPLAGADLADLKPNFAAPKIAYYFYSYIYEGYDELTGNPVFEDYGYTKTCDIAAVSNKGKVTFKQPGEVTIVAVDTVSRVQSNEVVIRVTAEADSMKAKNANMQVGQSIRLERLVEYKQGSAVLNQDRYGTYGRIDVKAAQASLKKSGKEDSFGISDDGYLTAFAKDNLNLELTDKALAETVEVRITAKELAPVKDLKAVNVIDNRFDVQFEMNPYAEAYRIEVKDDSRKTIRSIYVENIPFSEAPTAWRNNQWVHDPEYEDDDWGTESWGNMGDSEHYDDHWYRSDICRADKIKGKWVLTYRINRLTQMSKYQIEVKCLFGEAFSKTVSKAATTTKLPACDDVLTGNSTEVKQGVTICRLNETASVHSRTFVSGNTYSLWADVPNKAAQIAGTDTLTWTVSDKKVASVQAAPGGYSATLKALAPGRTVIEVKSKVLKGVIARVTITVSSVGDAYRNRDYYGDNEDLRGENPEKKELVTELTIGIATPVELSSGQSMRFKAVLTDAGVYTAYAVTNGRKTVVDTYTKRVGEVEEYDFGTIDGPFTGSVIVERTGGDTGVNKRTPIGLNEIIPSTGNAWYVFTAAEDGFYGFKNHSSLVGQPSDIKVYKQNAGGAINTSDEIEWNNYFFALKAGDMIYFRIRSSYGELRLVKGEFEPLTVDGSVRMSGYGEKWFAFTPAEMDEYELRLSDDESWASFYNAEFSSEVYWSDSDDGAGGRVYTGKCGAKVYIQVCSNTRTLTVQMTKKNTFRKFGEDGTYTIEEHVFNSSSDRLYLTYKIPTDGFYMFTCDASAGAGSGYATIYKDGAYVEGLSVSAGSTENSVERYYAAGEEIYLEMYAYGTPAAWNNIIFKAEKTGDAPVTLQTDAEAVPDTVEVGKAVWYELEATADGRYTVEFPQMADAASGAYITAALYESISDRNYISESMIYLQDGGDFSAGILSAGEKRFIKVTADEKQTFRIRVSKAEIRAANIPSGVTVTLDDLAFGANDSGSYEALVKITAGESGVYTFTCADNSVTGVSMYKDSDMTESGEDVKMDTTADSVTMYTATFYMAAGDSRYLNVQAGSALTGVSLKVRGLTERKLGRADVQSGEYQWFSYTASVDGTYVFFSEEKNGDPKVWFFHDQTDAGDAITSSELDDRSFTNNDDCGNNGFVGVTEGTNFAKDIQMAEGETVYFAVGHYSLGNQMTCDVYVWE